MDWDKFDMVVNLCVYHNKDQVMKILVEREGLTNERAHVIMCAALTYLKVKGSDYGTEQD